jgi:uncharacterized protein
VIRDRLPLLAGLLALALAIGIGSLVIADGIRARNSGDTISVTGSAKQRIVSDYIVWDAHVTARGGTAAGAADQLATWAARVRRFFTAQGVRPNELTESPISALAPGDVDDNGDTIDEYELTRSFQLRSDRVDAVAAVAERTAALIAQGVPLAGDPPQYIFTKLPVVRPRLLAEATKDAQRRARVLMAAAGGKLGGLRGVDVGVFQVTAPNSTDVSDYGVYDTATVEKDVTAVVNVTFALK